VQAYQHSCGGWYAAAENADGFHGAPAHCVCGGWATCWDSPEIALRMEPGMRYGYRPDGISDRAARGEGK